MPTNSGAQWVEKFPTSTKTSDLSQPFRANFESFQKAMKDAGISVRITASRRPRERAYLMHYAWMITKGKINPADVPPMAGIDIIWDHSQSKTGAGEMVDGYGIGSLHLPPSLNSRHIDGLAIDTVLSWHGDIKIHFKNGFIRTLVGEPRDSTHPDLIAAGESYGVIHMKPASADKVHWSDDGH
jgi:hypothetical protein